MDPAEGCGKTELPLTFVFLGMQATSFPPRLTRVWRDRKSIPQQDPQGCLEVWRVPQEVHQFRGQPHATSRRVRTLRNGSHCNNPCINILVFTFACANTQE